jgi:hypothetical protein
MVQRGSSNWALDGFRRIHLPSFLDDLQAIEATGFGREGSCIRVQHHLKEIGDLLDAIPNTRPPAQPIAADFRDFAELYFEWNNHSGDTPEKRQGRARAHKSLAAKRERLSGRIGKSLHALEGRIDWGTMDAVFEKLHLMVNDELLTGVFPLLQRSLNQFNADIRKYRR